MSRADPGFLGHGMLNGSLLAAGELKISPLGSGFMFGEGLFETIRVEEGQPQLFSAHVERLSDSMEALGVIDLPSEGELRARCAAVIAANGLARGSLKIVVFKDLAGWSELILARPATYTAAHYAAGFRLRTVGGAERLSPLAGRKTLNYLANFQAKRAALAAGFDEPLFVDPNQQVLEGATTNVFLVKGGVVATPPVSAHILPGIMRAHVIGLLLGNGAAVEERTIPLAELLSAEEVFVTNALLGVMPVAAVDSIVYDLGRAQVAGKLL